MPVGKTALRRLRSVEALSAHRLRVAWYDFPPMIVSLDEDVRRGGVFQSLRDEALFARVRIADDGYLIEWPEPADIEGKPVIDIDADALFALGLQQHVALPQQHTA
jgi:hypothetical protein